MLHYAFIMLVITNIPSTSARISLESFQGHYHPVVREFGSCFRIDDDR